MPVGGAVMPKQILKITSQKLELHSLPPNSLDLF